uniref:gp53-like domain-containing protein n=1 Tax=Xenorhabdus vietnamensis TaxID=351656 RepID=UPI003BB4E20E
VSEGVYIGKQRPDLVLSSLGTAKSRVNLSLWGINNRPTVLECHDDTGSIFYAQRSPNGSVIFSVDGEILPSNYGNFDARYGNKNTASKSERWWKCGDSGIIEQWGVVYVPDDEYREFEFPIFFPNRCDALVATPIYTAAVTSTNVISCHVNVRTNARFGVGLSATFSDPALNRVFWRAVGY